MADTTTERRMFCLQITLQAVSRADKIIKAEDIVEYSAVLEDYMRNGKKSNLKVLGE